MKKIPKNKVFYFEVKKDESNNLPYYISIDSFVMTNNFRSYLDISHLKRCKDVTDIDKMIIEVLELLGYEKDSDKYLYFYQNIIISVHH